MLGIPLDKRLKIILHTMRKANNVETYAALVCLFKFTRRGTCWRMGLLVFYVSLGRRSSHNYFVVAHSRGCLPQVFWRNKAEYEWLLCFANISLLYDS
jgi:hypothetical protein